MKIVWSVVLLALAAANVEAAEKPKFPNAKKVETLYLAGEVVKAKELMLTASEDQRDPGWYGFMIQLQVKLDESIDAERTAKEGIARYPRESSIYLGLASAYAARREYEKALETINQAQSVAAQDKKALGWALDQKARIFKSMGEYKAAQKTYDEILVSDPENVGFILNSMMIESALGNYRVCFTRFEKAKAVGLSPFGESVGIQFLSLAAYYSGNATEAQKHARELRVKNTGAFNSEVALMSFLLDDEADAVIAMLAQKKPPTDDTSAIYYAGLKARKGDASILKAILTRWSELSVGNLEALTIVLVHLKHQNALLIAQSLYEKNQLDPDFNYLFAYALKNAGKDYRKYSDYAVSKAPNNKVYQGL